jgi:hypothetical protein
MLEEIKKLPAYHYNGEVKIPESLFGVFADKTYFIG